MVYATFKGHCTKNAIDNAMEIAKNNGCDAIVGIGGGKALDTAKAVATNLGGIPTVIIPTIASNDAPCSSVAVIYNEEEMVIKALMMKQSPDVVLVDTGIIAKAPENTWFLALEMHLLRILKHGLVAVAVLKQWLEALAR